MVRKRKEFVEMDIQGQSPHENRSRERLRRTQKSSQRGNSKKLKILSTSSTLWMLCAPPRSNRNDKWSRACFMVTVLVLFLVSVDMN
jgi:hypothetical protein